MSADQRCVWCQDGEGTHWHGACWGEAHCYWEDEADSA